MPVIVADEPNLFSPPEEIEAFLARLRTLTPDDHVLSVIKDAAESLRKARELRRELAGRTEAKT